MDQSHLHIVAAKDLDYQPHEIDVIRKQVCHAIISSNAAYRLFENREMCKLFNMICGGTSDILPTGKSASGGLLDQCAEEAEAELKGIFKGREVGASYVIISGLLNVELTVAIQDGRVEGSETELGQRGVQ
jgi:hypothetical protein